MGTSVIEQYFKRISGERLLTREEEVALAKRIEQGDLDARRILIESNLRLAISIAKKYAQYGGNLEDLIQESNIGLMKAVDRFDWRKGNKFSTYACHWIRQAVTRHLTNNNTILKVPSHTKANARKIWKLKQAYQEEHGKDPTDDEISETLNISEKHIKQATLSIRTKNLASIDQPLGVEGNRTYADVIPDNTAVKIDDILDNQIIRENIVKALSSLSKREELVLRLRFGIDDVQENDQNIYEVKETH